MKPIRLLFWLGWVAMPSVAYPAFNEGFLVDSPLQNVRMTASDHFLFSQAKSDVDPAGPASQFFLNEGKVRAEWNAWNGDLHFSNRYQSAPTASGRPTLRLEKKTVRFESPDFQILAGDSHQELGRGMALSLFSEPVFGIDNTLEGISAKYRPSGFEIGGFAGRVNVLRDPVAINPIDMRMGNRNVLLGGGSVGFRLAQETKVGAHYVITLNQRKEDLDLDKRLQTVGLTFSQDNIFDTVDFYVESNVMIPDTAFEGRWIRNANARANYLSLSWSEAPWKVKLEAKDYARFDYDFRKPPSLEEDVPLANVPNNFSDITAARMSVEFLTNGGAVKPSSSFIYGKDRLENVPFYHAFLGTKLAPTPRSELELRSGYRVVADRNRIYHASLKGKLKTWPGQMVELELRKQFSFLQLNTVPAKEDRNAVALTYSFSENWSLTGGFEAIPTNDPETGKQFLSLAGSYRRGGLTSRAFLGKTSGGAQCAGGVCRQVPPYSGAMLETTYAF